MSNFNISVAVSAAKYSTYIDVFFFWVYQIAILECNEFDTNYFFDCFAGFQGMVFFLKKKN